MNVFIYLSKEITDVDKQYLLSLFALFDTDIHCTFGDKKGLSSRKYALVHIVGCWDARAIKLQKQAAERRIPVLISLWGTLNPWYIRHIYFPKRFLLAGDVQQMVKQATAIHICGELEQQLFLTKGWNTTCERIDNGSVSHTVEKKTIVVQLRNLYYKILDTKPASMLNQTDEELIGSLLLAGTDPERFNDIFNDGDITLNIPQATHWRYILMYVQQEKVFDIFKVGLNKLSLNTPLIDIASTDRFELENYPDGELSSEVPQTKSLILKNRVGKITSCQEEHVRRLGMMTLNLYIEVETNRMPLRHLIDLYRSLRLYDYDESLFIQLLKEVSLLRFFMRIEFVLQEFVKLTEGFMPILPLEDKKARELKKRIIKI